MGRALMARLLGGDLHGDYVAPVELVERASLQAPRLPVNVNIHALCFVYPFEAQ
jgi:hypothetical protein